MMADANQRLRGMLGFAMRAGKLVIGSESVLNAVSSKKPPELVIVASGVSEGTKKKLTTKCEFYEIKLVQINIGADELGDLLGKTYSPATICVMDKGFAREIEKLTFG